MRAFIDLDTGKFIAAPGVTSEITEFRFKRSPSSRVEVQFTRNGLIEELAVDGTGIFGVKTTGEYDADYVTAALEWLKTGSGATTVYSFTLSLINTTLDDLFVVDGDPENDVPQLELMGELQWTVGGNAVKSPTIKVLIDNDVNRGGEGLPETPAIVYGVFLAGITALEGGAASDLDGVPTIGFQTGMIVEVLVEVTGVLSWLTYRLVDGPATDAAPGQVEPDDYDAVDNDRHWEGAVGPSGVAGATWRDGVGVPSDALGVNDDYYLNRTNGDVYKKAAGAYAVVTNIVGPPGAEVPGADGVDGVDGVDGATWRSAADVPDDEVGVDGDYHLNTLTGDVYQRAAGVYSVFIANIMGPPGADGVDGIDGAGGEPIIPIGAPSGTEDPMGVDGSERMDDNYLYGKTEVGWKRIAWEAIP